MEMKQNQTFFHETYSNLTPYFSLSKNIEIFQWLSKSKFLSLMTKVNQNYGNETKSDIFQRYVFKSDVVFLFPLNTKIFLWLLWLALFDLIVKVNAIKKGEIKSHGTCGNLTVFFLFYKVVHYLNDFWNLFLDKVYFKNEWY